MDFLLKPLSLYIHWPFCLSKCPYCDFNSHVRQTFDEEAWQEGLLHELERYADHIKTWEQPYTLQSIFFGGGTPSLMQPQTVERLIDKALQLWGRDPSLEITLEANPNSVEVQRFQALRQAGINRLSLGIQAFNDTALKQLGRQHSTQEALKALEIACDIFSRVSFDLIYARPGQTLQDWQEELIKALSFGTEHLSLYQLTIEPGTAFASLYNRGELILPDEERSADLFEMTQAVMNNSQRPAYEISNHAKKGAECRHNLTYWTYQDYIGIGPGAHGRLTCGPLKKQATRQKKSPEGWLRSIQDQGHGDAEIIQLSLQDQLKEQLLMGLRLTEGIPLETLVMPLEQAFADKIINHERWHHLCQNQYLDVSQDRIKATDSGRQRLQAVLDYIL